MTIHSTLTALRDFGDWIGWYPSCGYNCPTCRNLPMPGLSSLLPEEIVALPEPCRSEVRRRLEITMETKGKP